MEYDEIMGGRLAVLETRIAALEQQLFVLVQGSKAITKRQKREFTPEQRAAIRARLVAGQERKRTEREAQIVAQAQTQSQVENKGKGKSSKNKEGG
jgi:hypothetical protein